MKSRYFIKGFTAGLLALLFLVSITPKQYLHNIFAKHADTSSSSTQTSGSWITDGEGYNCDCSNLVATSPFVDIIQNSGSFILPVYEVDRIPHLTKVTTSTFIVFSLRGPPALG